MCMHVTKDTVKSIEKTHTQFPWQRRRKRKEETTVGYTGETPSPPKKIYIMQK